MKTSNTKASKKKIILTVLGIILALLLCAALAIYLFVRASISGDMKGESPFTDLETVDFAGSPVTTADLAENKLTVINAWNVDCVACVEELPILDRLDREYGDRGVAVMGLYYDSDHEVSGADREAIAAVLADAKAEYTQLMLSDSMEETRELASMFAFPTTYLVDSQGEVVTKVVGDQDYEGWRLIIEQALEKVENNG